MRQERKETEWDAKWWQEKTRAKGWKRKKERVIGEESESERDASQIHMFVSLQIREGAYEHEHLFMRDFWRLNTNLT